MKAFFDESRVIANPVQPDPADPTRLVPYGGPPLRVGGELNKLAVNFGFGRNSAGMRQEISRSRGREVKSLGDGFLATFDSPAPAVRCAAAIVKGDEHPELARPLRPAHG